MGEEDGQGLRGEEGLSQAAGVQAGRWGPCGGSGRGCLGGWGRETVCEQETVKEEEEGRPGEAVLGFGALP